jgi:hypothetical protein
VIARIDTEARPVLPLRLQSSAAGEAAEAARRSLLRLPPASALPAARKILEEKGVAAADVAVPVVVVV